MSVPRLVLVTGATGYVGGRLVPRLLEAGYRVRVLVRDAARVQGRPWAGQVEISQGDVLRPETLTAAIDGVTAAYYLVHSMREMVGFRRRDIVAARHFGSAAQAAGVEQIIYLGGLGDPHGDTSEHLRSRRQTGMALREAGVPVTEFRVTPIIGSGSISFEMIRHLSERLPVMICPPWAYRQMQPIAIRDVLSYLVAALDVPESSGQMIEIGGADVLPYMQMLQCYARARGLRRILIPLPVQMPRLLTHGAHWLTPIPASMAHPLIEGLRNEMVVRNDQARVLFPQIQPLGYATAISLALQRLEANEVDTSWSDAVATSEGDIPPVTLTMEEGFITERRRMGVPAPPEAVYRVFTGLGGRHGWLYANSAWRLRGAIDRLLGGVGFRRGRRHPTELRVGDAVDFWRVEAVEPGRLLRLRAEMRVPGRAWLQFTAHPRSDGTTWLVQTAFFAPRGLLGLLYWYLLYPIHSRIFSHLVREIAKKAAPE